MTLRYSFRKSDSDLSFGGEFSVGDKLPLKKAAIKPLLTEAVQQKWEQHIDLNKITWIECYFYDKNNNEVIINQ